MGKKAEVWKEKYNDLADVTTSYIRELQLVKHRLATLEHKVSDCSHVTCNKRMVELESDLAQIDQELAEERELTARLDSEKYAIAMARSASGSARVSELEAALKNLLKSIEDARVLRVSLIPDLDREMRVHLFESEWDDICEHTRTARNLLE